MGKYAVLVVLIGFVFNDFSAGQVPICGNDILDSLMNANNPEYINRWQSIENSIREMSPNRTTTESNLDRVIPVVVHIVRTPK